MGYNVQLVCILYPIDPGSNTGQAMRCLGSGKTISVRTTCLWVVDLEMTVFLVTVKIRMLTFQEKEREGGNTATDVSVKCVSIKLTYRPMVGLVA
jgi:hypothetical protein